MKSTIILINKRILRKVFVTLESGVFLPNIKRGGEEELKLFDDWVKYLKSFCRISIIGYYVTIIFALITWSIEKSSKYPFGDFPEIVNFETTLILQIFIYVILATAYVIIEVTYFTILGHIQCHLVNLQNYLKNITKRIKNSHSDVLKDLNTFHWDILTPRIKIAVDYHVAIYQVSKDIDKTYRFCHLVGFVTITIIFCVLMYDLSFKKLFGNVFLLEILYISVLLALLCFNCYCGNETLNKSLEVALACTEINFLNTDIRFQKALILIIQRSQKPICFKVGNFVLLTSGTAVSVSNKNSQKQ
ncbi:hypothetical protein RN001_001571 [Aquatica leii]|uniref:Uncharacterized protein n=1 Tax=Aquatica leii TaxID=1421715 RepID=A0AAN7SSN6_9COLE|nr:hypothetical protein RN001_001571 [Aquatica leii]